MTLENRKKAADDIVLNTYQRKQQSAHCILCILYAAHIPIGDISKHKQEVCALCSLQKEAEMVQSPHYSLSVVMNQYSSSRKSKVVLWFPSQVSVTGLSWLSSLLRVLISLWGVTNAVHWQVSPPLLLDNAAMLNLHDWRLKKKGQVWRVGICMIIFNTHNLNNNITERGSR